MIATLLGTGTPAPTAKRAAAGYVVQFGDHTVVFDHGPGAHARMIQAGIPLTSVTHLFLTHFHYDHFLDVPALILRRWDQGAGRIGELPIYGPPPLKRIISLMFDQDGIFQSDLDARTRNEASVALYHARGGKGTRPRPVPHVTELQPGDEVRQASWTVRTVQTPHTQPQMNTLAYRLECDSGSLVYSGDTGPCDDLVDLARGADVMIHMCHYVSGTEYNEAMTRGCAGHRTAADHAARAGVGTLVLTHLTEQVDTDGVRERVLADIREIFPGRVIWGEDLKRLDVTQLKSRDMGDPL